MKKPTKEEIENIKGLGIGICPNCHILIDNSKLQIKTILQLREQREKEILDIIDEFKEKHIHTTYPNGKIKCYNPKKCYLNKKLEKLKQRIKGE